MNYDIIQGLTRAFTPIIVAWLIKRGLTPDDAGNMVQWGGDAIIALVTLAAGVWSVMRNREAGQIAKTAALSGVKSIEVDPASAPAFDETAKVKVAK